MGTVPMTGRSDVATRGFTLLEIALAMAILSVVTIYTLQMYQSMRSSKKQADGVSKAEQISDACRVYFSGHESLPDAGTSFADSVPIDALGLGQEYRFDAHGRPFLYYVSSSASGLPSASGFQVDGMDAAGVIISLGGNQLQDYTATVTGTETTYTTIGDDVLVPIEVNGEAVAIALAELESLGKGVEAYQREYAGIQNDDPVENFYGNEAAGAPPAPPFIDPDEYDVYYDDWPQLYPYQPYYPTFSEAGPPPTDADLAYDEPDRNWPPNDPSGANIYVDWPSYVPLDPPAGTVPPEGPDLPPDFAGWSVPGPGYSSWPFGTNVFGEYETPWEVPDPPLTSELVEDSYELIDEGGCNPSAADSSCVYVYLDSIASLVSDTSPVGDIRPVSDLVGRYGLGTSFLADPWGNAYWWGAGLLNTDPRYHLFYSAGPDTIAGTDDDVILY